MNLRDANGTDVPISVDVVDTTAELVSGEVLALGEGKPDKVMTLEDTQRLQGTMLIGGRKNPTFSRAGPAKG
jgi:hypothetical protein